MRLMNFLSILSLLLLVGGCSALNYDKTADWTVEQHYQEARDALDNDEYDRAVELYTKLESRFPYGRYTQQAQLETIYAHYKANETASAIAAADRFIKFHPRHPNVDYAYYLRGLVTFDQSKGFLSSLFKLDPSERDPAGVRESFNYFKDLVQRYPNSRYSHDAVKRMAVLRNTLAKHEVHAAAYYLNRGTYLAAANRAKYVLENYQKSAAIPDALVIMVKAYREMGMDDLANDAMRVLEMNYPELEALSALKNTTSTQGE